MSATAHFSAPQLAQTWYFPLVLELRQTIPVTILNEHNRPGYTCQFPERFLQALWNEQQMAADLYLQDGRHLRVLSPGTWNVSAGPDFRNAVLVIAGEQVRGDVEIHRTVADWHAHGHTGDPAYDNVILHIVWKAGGGDSTGLPPTLELAATTGTDWEYPPLGLDPENYPYGRMIQPGRCAEQLEKLSDDPLRELLRAAGLARLARKAERLLESITGQGPDQALYEGVFGALGYAKNKDAFASLARAVPVSTFAESADPQEKRAVVWGVSGLLPDPSSTRVNTYLKEETRELWRLWWRSGLPVGDFAWRRSGCRPLNSPERRLAAGCRWLESCSFSPLQWLKGLVGGPETGKELFKKLVAAFAFDSAWEHCVDFQHCLKRPVALLGMPRRRDIVMNIILPFLLAYGTHSRQPSLKDLAESAWLAAPKLQKNRRMTEGVHRFLFPPSRADSVVRGGAEQQGLMEMYESLCQYCGGNCGSCPLSSIIPVEFSGEKC